ncbi:hypothetical protein BDV96DRAFT_581988 [Lophiotrema nucula]|uniref:Heterokaryon incompatibility domain-containing protein n=1 Tax=Lophiotrema nucula TaxID=690887 RepID=A0A6A5YYZ9_9PLEO|nr:hypothetical protein BDV96DRAFT_581988 [Lophiotrema nucula]
MEIWYDYISVPQWEKPLKERIISAITRVFYNAHFTLVHLSDIDDNTIKLLRHGGTQEDRIRGVTGICNAKWFSRVWTVMELIRSQNPRVMNSHYRIVERVRDVFLDEVNDVWNSELVASGNVHELESLAQMGKNIVPWNLGPLRISHIAKVVDFGTAFTLLSRRGCASDSDFFEALLGIVRPRRVEGKLSSDPAQAMRQIAVSCLEMGDYSPLLMMSRSYNGGDNHTFYSTSAHRNGAAHLLERCGYLDVMTYALGPLEGFPTHHAESEFRPGLRLKLEIIGKVTFAMTDTTRLFQPWLFLIIARTVLNFTGPNVDQFVRTIGSRLYNLCNEDVEEVLSDKDAWARIHEILYQWYNKTGTSHNDEERFPSGQTLAGLIGLDRIRTRSHRLVSAMDWMGEHGGTLHGANAGNLIAARCLGCHETFVYRAAFLRPPSEVYGSMAYRLAGVLHQGRSNESLGILVKDTEIVGRLVWASRACECRLTEKVDISLHDLPKRRPRN